jgi:uroporphyrinogen-III synthase
MVSIAPRRGLQALVTRPREEAETLAALLAARGVGALIEPLMQVHYHDMPALDLAGVQAVLCTSANGVRALALASGERRVPLLAVGDATTARAREEGFVSVSSAGGDAAGLVRLTVESLLPQAGLLLHAGGSAVAGDLVGALRARGFTVERRVLYEARPITALSPAAVRALRAGAIDLALFFSPRTAAIFVRLAGDAGVARSCGTIAALSISAAVDAALGELSWGERRVAARPDQPALLDALDRFLADRSGNERR